MTAAFSAVTGIPETDLFKLIGHTGGKVIDPYAPGVSGYRGFHVQEIAYALRKRGFYIQEWQKSPKLNVNASIVDVKPKGLRSIIAKSNGVIVGKRPTARWHHAWYKVDNVIIDPDTDNKVSMDKINVLAFYEVGKR